MGVDVFWLFMVVFFFTSLSSNNHRYDMNNPEFFFVSAFQLEDGR